MLDITNYCFAFVIGFYFEPRLPNKIQFRIHNIATKWWINKNVINRIVLD